MKSLLGWARRDGRGLLLRSHVSPDQILEWDNGIRATVTGAGQFTMQISSETVWLDPRFQLPLRSVPVYGVPLD